MSKRNNIQRINALAAANSAALLTLFWQLFCRFFYLPFPSLTINIFQNWFPALQLQALWVNHLLGSLFIGIATLPVAVWLTVFAFVKLYEKMN